MDLFRELIDTEQATCFYRNGVINQPVATHTPVSYTPNPLTPAVSAAPNRWAGTRPTYSAAYPLYALIRSTSCVSSLGHPDIAKAKKSAVNSSACTILPTATEHFEHA